MVVYVHACDTHLVRDVFNVIAFFLFSSSNRVNGSSETCKGAFEVSVQKNKKKVEGGGVSPCVQTAIVLKIADPTSLSNSCSLSLY